MSRGRGRGAESGRRLAPAAGSTGRSMGVVLDMGATDAHPTGWRDPAVSGSRVIILPDPARVGVDSLMGSGNDAENTGPAWRRCPATPPTPPSRTSGPGTPRSPGERSRRSRVRPGWDNSCHSCIGLTFPPVGNLSQDEPMPFRRSKACRIARSTSGHTAGGHGFRTR